MERCAELIEKLKKDFEANATPEQLMVTVCLLQKELSGGMKSHPHKRAGKVTVVMPTMFQFNDNIVQSNNEQHTEEHTEETVPDIQSPEANIIDKSKYDFPEEVTETIEVDKIEAVVEKEEEKPEEKLEEKQEEVNAIVFEELPTTAQNEKQVFQLNTKEETSTELNDQLQSSEKIELVDVLNEKPIKDLKKGITLNDRFIFISELFRGDENMYERSIKTINNFEIFPEAQFWIERELRTKIGWDVNNETVQHFYELVKRRFA